MRCIPRSTSRPCRAGLALAFLAVALAGCGGGGDSSPPPPPPPVSVTVPFTDGAAPTTNPVAYWNKVATDTINLPPAPSGTPEEMRPLVQVDLATVHVAIYDAVNGIVGTHKPFAVTPTAPTSGASQEAAAAAAAYGVLRGLFPARSDQYQGAYDAFIATIPAGEARTRGLAVGSEVARGVLAMRAGDGRMTLAPFTPGTAPGRFRGVNPIGTNIPYIKPFTLASAAQFRPAAPPVLTSAAYATDFEEVLRLGGTISAARTADQLDIARFHTESPNTFPTRNYRAFAMDARSLADNARIAAMIWVALADATIGCFEAKYHYEFWRPQSAIPLADSDGNPVTAPDAAWTPVVPTPNHPEYPSGHACLNSAAMAVIRAHFGTDKVTFTMSSTVTGSNRVYATPAAFIDELLLARIYGGMHFRSACVAGNQLGDGVGAWIVANRFQKLP